VEQQNAPDLPVEGWLQTLGIGSLTQWEVLIFVYRHRTSLVRAETIARLLGYASDPVVAALDVLESLGFVERSQANRVARLYQFALPPDSRRREGFERLIDLADSRLGWLRLRKVLRPGDQPAPEGSRGARDVAAPGQSLPPAGQRPRLLTRPHTQDTRQKDGGATWREVS
jgi:hypothetical protein